MQLVEGYPYVQVVVHFLFKALLETLGDSCIRVRPLNYFFPYGAHNTPEFSQLFDH